MALTEETNGIGATMLVSPTGGNFGGYGYPVMPMMPYGQGNGGGMFGGNDSWLGILFLIALCNGGFGFGGGFGGGYGNMMLGYDFPWLLNGQNGINNNVSEGFRDAQLHDSITSVQNAISDLATQLCQCCGDMRYDLANSINSVNSNLCNGFNGVNNTIFGAQTALAQQMNTNEIANLNRSFAEQTANAQGFNNVQAGLSDVRYTVATENCQDRYEAAQNTRDIIESNTRNTQAILDKLCALELDGVKSQLAQAQRENNGLQNQINMANLAASQATQTSDLRASQLAANTALLNELRSCPIPSQPVYGNQAIFSCPQQVNSCGCNNGCGCGCGSF